MERIGIICLAILLLMLPCIAAAQTPLTIETKANEQGIQVSILIPENSGAAVMQFGLQYDEGALELTDAKSGDSLSGTPAPIINRTEDGKVYFVWDSVTPIKNGGAVLTLTFETKKPGKYDDAVTFDPEYELLVLNQEYAEITVGSGDVEQDITEPPAENPPEDADEDETLPPAYIEIEGDKETVQPGEEIQLTPELVGEDNTGEPPVWYSNDETVATVDQDGNVIANSAGTATITAMTADGAAVGEYVITVESEQVAETKSDSLTAIICGGLLIIAGGTGAYMLKKKKDKEEPLQDK